LSIQNTYTQYWKKFGSSHDIWGVIEDFNQLCFTLEFLGETE